MYDLSLSEESIAFYYNVLTVQDSVQNTNFSFSVVSAQWF